MGSLDEPDNLPLRLAVITDIQYADKPDQVIPYIGTTRQYGKALEKLADAVKNINQKNVMSTIHLGDIIDGNSTDKLTNADLHNVIETLQPLKNGVWHVIGNHCLAGGKGTLMDALKLKKGYYAKYLEGWTVIVIDTVDVSVATDDAENKRLAEEYLKTHKDEQNAHDWNGGLSPAQKEWLRSELRTAKNAGQKVVVCGHIPVMCHDTQEHVIYESEDVHQIFLNGGVKAYFAGHYHGGDYTQRDGIHYLTFESIIDSSEKGSWGVIELNRHEIVLEGHGDMKSRTLTF